MSWLAQTVSAEGAAADDAGAAEPRHEPAMVSTVVERLVRRPNSVFVDATVGAGGHAAAALTALPPDNICVALDVDAAALVFAGRRLSGFGSRVVLRRASFRRLDTVVSPYCGRVTNILFDLGLSSDQLADHERGFSFEADGPLSMRFDGDADGLTAAEVVNTFDERALADIIYDLGGERRARAIARVLVARRRERPFETAADLAAVVARGGRRGRLHPATRTFQALRIYVNDELGALAAALPQAVAALAAGGRLFVIAYHSLEDRVVKRFFRAQAAADALELLTPKPLRPEAVEVRANRRSRSARLRVAQKK